MGCSIRNHPACYWGYTHDDGNPHILLVIFLFTEGTLQQVHPLRSPAGARAPFHCWCPMSARARSHGRDGRSQHWSVTCAVRVPWDFPTDWTAKNPWFIMFHNISSYFFWLSMVTPMARVSHGVTGRMWQNYTEKAWEVAANHITLTSFDLCFSARGSRSSSFVLRWISAADKWGCRVYWCFQVQERVLNNGEVVLPTNETCPKTIAFM